MDLETSLSKPDKWNLKFLRTHQAWQPPLLHDLLCTRIHKSSADPLWNCHWLEMNMWCLTYSSSILHPYQTSYRIDNKGRDLQLHSMLSHVLFSNRSPMISERSKNKNVAISRWPSVSLMFLAHSDIFCDLCYWGYWGYLNSFSPIDHSRTNQHSRYYIVLENSPKKLRTVIGLKSCFYNSMKTLD